MKKNKKSISLYIIIISISIIVIGIVIWGILTKWKFLGSKSAKSKPHSIRTKFVGPVIKNPQKYYTRIKKLNSDGSFILDNDNSFILTTSKCGIYPAFLPFVLQKINNYIIKAYKDNYPDIKKDILKIPDIEMTSIKETFNGFTMSCESIDAKITDCTLPDTIQPKLKLTCTNVNNNSLILNGGITPLSLEIKLEILLTLKNFQVQWDLLNLKFIEPGKNPTITCSLSVGLTFDFTIKSMEVDISKISQQTIDISNVDTTIDMKIIVKNFTKISDTIKNLVCSHPAIVAAMTTACSAERAAACTTFTACHAGCDIDCIFQGDACKNCSLACDSVGLMDVCGICGNFPNNNDKYLPADCEDLSTISWNNCMTGLCFSVSEKIINNSVSKFSTDQITTINKEIKNILDEKNGPVENINNDIDKYIQNLHSIPK